MPLVTILARNMRLKIISTNLEGGASAASHDIGARKAIENFSINLGVASATSHDIGARNAIENFELI